MTSRSNSSMPRAVVRGLREVADRVLAAEVAHAPELLDDLLRCAAAGLRRAHGVEHRVDGGSSGLARLCRARIRATRSSTSASDVPTTALKLAERTIAS